MSASRSNLALLTAPNLTTSFLPDAIRSSRSTAPPDADGGLPGVGVRLRCVATDEEYFYPSSKMSVNSVNRLCFPTDIDFTPGEWEAIIGSQYTPTYHLYKKERYGYLTFTVV